MKLFIRSIPENVTWNELFDLCDNASKMSALLDEQNTIRKREGRSTLLRTVVRHNQVVRHLMDVVGHESFPAFAHANDCTPGDMAFVRFASHPKYL